MPKTLLFEIVALVVSFSVAVISLILYLGEYRRRRDEKDLNPFQTLSATNNKGFGLLHQAMKKAQAIIGNAELQGIKVAAQERLTLRKTEEQFKDQLTASREEMTQEMSAQMNTAYSEYIKFLEGLKSQNNQIQANNQEAIKQRIDAIFDRFEQNLGTFLTSTEQKSITAIELELKSARQLIETYKTEQMTIIDENIVSILERTLTIVLAKKIPLKDQMDLIYEALNKAKAEKFIV